MLKIRLQRTGRKHEPTFRLVLTESTNSTKSGRYHEVLGSHDPRREDATVLKDERIKHWLGNGAKASGTVHNLLISKGIIAGKKVNVLPKKKPLQKEGGEEAAPASNPAPAPEAAPEQTAA